MNFYHNGHALAIAAGSAAILGACALLLAEPITTGYWSLDHALTPLIVGLTVAGGHLATTALCSRKPLAAVGFAVAFLIGTAVTVLNGVGRQAETAETRIAEVAKANAAIVDKQADLAKARQRFEQANKMAEREMTGQRCGNRCQDWKTRAAEVESHIAILEVQVAKLGAVKPVNPKAAKVGELAAVLGGDPAKAQTVVGLVEPLLVPFLLEWMAIVALGYGFEGNRRRDVTEAPEPATVAAVAMPAAPAAGTVGEPVPPPQGGNRRLRQRTRKVATRAAAEADVISLVARGERLPSQQTLAMRWGVHKGTASKWLADFECRNLVTRVASGRVKQVAAAPLRAVA